MRKTEGQVKGIYYLNIGFSELTICARKWKLYKVPCSLRLLLKNKKRTPNYKVKNFFFLKAQEGIVFKSKNLFKFKVKLPPKKLGDEEMEFEN